jgi:hypothetical protein
LVLGWGKSCHTAELPYVFEAMDIIRSDYSTLSPIAQEEAPVPPEYPYTDLLAAYRGALEDNALGENDDENQGKESTQRESSATSSLSSRLSNYTAYFQRVLEHFFEDYFQEDADEEIAHDMAQRWVAFARTGNPNYENSKVEWIPWRFVPDDDVDGGLLPSSSENDLPWDREERHLYNLWRNTEELALDALEQDDNRVNSEEEQESFIAQAYRTRALEVLSMKVVEEDSLRTELIRNKQITYTSSPDDEYTFSTFGRPPKRRSNSTSAIPGELTTGNGDILPKPSHRMIQQIQRMAQDMGVLGRGLSGEYDRLLGGNLGAGNRRGHDYWEGKIHLVIFILDPFFKCVVLSMLFMSYLDDFFPQLLELQWPPEERLVRRCNCSAVWIC